MISDSDYKRLLWASRRGMLELDLVLVPFVENRFKQLDEADQQRYIQLVEEEDTDLFAWTLGRQRPDDADLARIVDLIMEMVDPESWEDNGGVARMSEIEGKIVITQTLSNHLTIERLLTTLNRELSR